MAIGPNSKIIQHKIIQHLRRVVLQQELEEMADGRLLEFFLAQRDEAAFAALLRRHGPMVWGVCRRLLRNHHDAEDVFQATFLILVRKGESIIPREMVANWLYGVAYRVALKARALSTRRQQRERQVTEVLEPASVEPDDKDDLQSLLDQELSRLPSKYRVPIVLCDLEGKTRQEAARQLGWPEGTVAGRLARARTMLAKRLTRCGLVMSSGTLAVILSQQPASGGVPTSVEAATFQAATQLFAGQTAGVISPTVAVLMEEVLRAMWMAKLKIGMAGCLVLAALGISLLTYSAKADSNPVASEQQRTSAADTPRQPTEEPQPRATLRGHTDIVVSVAFSPAGTTLASVSYDQTVKLWDVRTGKEQMTLPGHTNTVWPVAFSPDGKTVASGSLDKTIKLWDVVSGKTTATLAIPDGPVYAVAFSPNGRTLASGSSDEMVRLWDIGTGKQQAALAGHAADVYGVVFSPDGHTLASADDKGTIKLWTVATGQERATLTGHKQQTFGVVFSPDGKTVVSGSDDSTIKLWEVATGKERATLTGHTRGVRSVAFELDGQTLVSGSLDKTIRVWQLSNGTNTVTWQAHDDMIGSVALRADGRVLASASVDHTVKLWDFTAVMQRARKPEPVRADLPPQDLDRLWITLAADDAKVAYQAIGMLVGASQPAIALLQERLRLTSEPNPQQVAGWITDLDDGQFAVRRQATEALEKLNDLAGPALRQKLTEKPSLEVRQRIEQLVTKIEVEGVRTLRAVEVLEAIGDSGAKRVLETLATGVEGARLTSEAKVALERLQKRTAAAR